MADLPGALGKQVGPFPIAGWLAIGAAGIGLAVVIRRSDLFGGAGNVDPVDAGAGDPAANGDLYTPVDGLAGGSVTIPGQSQPRPPAGPTTNGEWSRAAVSWAIGAGIDPNVAAGAAANYLSGVDMSYAQGQALSRMLTALGPPPEGAPAPNIVGGPPGPVPLPVLPVTPPRPAPRNAPGPVTLYYTTVAGTTFAGIAQAFYGSSSKARQLWEMNRYIRQAGIQPSLGHQYNSGVRVWLPLKLNDGTPLTRTP